MGMNENRFSAYAEDIQELIDSCRVYLSALEDNVNYGHLGAVQASLDRVQSRLNSISHLVYYIERVNTLPKVTQ